jgi:hypothetical protein
MGYQRLKQYEPVVDTCPADKYFLSNIQPQVLQGSEQMAATTEGTTFVGEQYDDHYLAITGWEKINETNTGYKLFFSEENMTRLYNQICKQLRAAGYNIAASRNVIAGVMSSVLRNHTPQIGDLYTRYNIPLANARNDIAQLNERVVNIIVSSIINEEDTRKWNESLNVWTTVLGDFNSAGLRAHPIIRKRENDYMKGQFNMNY